MALKDRFARQGEEEPDAPSPEQATPEQAPDSADAFLAGEVARWEKIAAIPGERMKTYVEQEFDRLPVLTRALLLCLLPADCRPEPIVCHEVMHTTRLRVDTPDGPRLVEQQEPVELDAGTAGRILRLLGPYPVPVYSGAPTKEPNEEDRRLIALYGEGHREAWQLYLEHEKRIETVKKEGEAAQQAAVAEYKKHFESLTAAQRPFALYACARQFPPQGHSGFHFLSAPATAWPFAYYAWARTEPVNGVAFCINRACFAQRDPLLFFAYDYYPDIPRGLPLEKAGAAPGSPWLTKVWSTIEGCSSGIRVEGLWGRVVLFRPDEKNIRKLDIFYGYPNMGPSPDYVFTWPGAGEFACTLGEVVDGKMVPLLRDDFVMK